MAGDAIAVDAATQSFGIRCAPLIGIGLMLVFMVAQGIYMSRHMKPAEGDKS